jgi:DNA-binding CsgD family transcriptional regulator
MVLQDITTLKEKEKAKLLEVEDDLKKMERCIEETNLEKQVLNLTLSTKTKELVSKMMQISKRNSELETIRNDLKILYRESNKTAKMKITKVIQQLTNTLDIEDGWETFNIYFKEIHPCFLEKLESNYPTLSDNEIRHCSFIKLRMNNREVADLLNISSKTVEATRYRIKKKLNLTKEDSLSNFIHSISFQNT